jgi:DNA-binding CsgD family transcriptional regulator
MRLAAARSHLLGGDFARARALDEQVATTGSPRARLRAAVGYEAASWRPGLPGHRSVELLTAALRGIDRDPSDPVCVRAVASLGRALAFTGATEEASVLGAQAIDLARALRDDDLLAHALQASLWQGLRPQDAPMKLARATELSRLADRTGDMGHLGPGAYYRGVICYLQGEPDGLAAAHADLVRMARATGQGLFDYMAGCMDYGRKFSTGDFAGAERTAAALLELGSTFGTDDTEGPYGVQTYMVRREQGALEQVRSLISGDERPSEHWAPGLLALYTELGLDTSAARLLRSLLDDDLLRYQNSAQWPGVLAFLVEAALALEDQAAAQRLRPMLEEYAGLNLFAGQFVALFGSADRYLGAVDSLLGRGEPEEWFDSALRMDTRMGAPVHQAQTLAAQVVHRRRTGSDRETLDEVVGRTRSLAEPLGLRRVLRMLRTPGAPDADQGPPDGLTPRELEVLRLLSEGLINREIAKRLFISENTAANHVRSILAKTGCANRTRAAMYAHARGLVS